MHPQETEQPNETMSSSAKPVPEERHILEQLTTRLGRIVRDRGLRRFLRNPLSAVGLCLLVLFILIALLAPWLAPPAHPWDAYKVPQDGLSAIPKPPRAEAWQTFPPDWHMHPFGVASGGYDIYYGIIWGTRTAFFVSLVVVSLSLLIGLLFGSLAAYCGGWVDEILMRSVDVLLIFPDIVLVITLVVIIGRYPNFELFGFTFSIDRLSAVMLALIVAGWTVYARLVRGEILSAKEKEYVLAARTLGAGHTRIIFRHILPNTIYPVLVAASLDIGRVVLAVSGLSFLGLGPEPGYADWGQMVSFARQYVTQVKYWYVIVIPGLAITLFVLVWNLLGDAFRDALDPKLSGAR